MHPEALRGNLEKTLAAMKRQTGKVPGGPTGLCHPVVIGALTGRELLFVERSVREQEQLERHTGFEYYELHERWGRTPLRTIPDALTQTEIEQDAIMVMGKLKAFNEYHIAAIVPDNANPPYHIIDSLLPGATEQYETVEEVLVYLDNQFHKRKMTAGVVPTAEEKRKRRKDGYRMERVRIGEGVTIYAPKKQEPERMRYYL